MLKTAALLAAAVVITNLSAQDRARAQDGPIVTGNRPTETADALKTREAIAYARPLPRGAPSADYPLVAWCDALVTGHADLGETLTSRAPEDVELVRLGRLEAQDFRSALAAAAPRQSVASKAEAEQVGAADGQSRRRGTQPVVRPVLRSAGALRARRAPPARQHHHAARHAGERRHQLIGSAATG